MVVICEHHLKTSLTWMVKVARVLMPNGSSIWKVVTIVDYKMCEGMLFVRFALNFVLSPSISILYHSQKFLRIWRNGNHMDCEGGTVLFMISINPYDHLHFSYLRTRSI